MNNEQRMVREFHKKFGFTINDNPTIISEELGNVRQAHTLKEVEELKEAMDNKDLIEIADALVDIQYFIYGTAIAYGIDLEPCFAEIHRSNMSKDRPDPTQYVDAKAVKGPNYSPPNLTQCLFRINRD